VGQYVDASAPLIGGAEKRHDKNSWPNPIAKHIQVLQHNQARSGHATPLKIGGIFSRKRNAIHCIGRAKSQRTIS
jgi:hypothetical protein